MKYEILKHEMFGKITTHVMAQQSNEVCLSFPAEVGNPNYDAFLEQAQLTDKQVHSLKPDVWYDFPE
jgi:hypothetical protein